MFEICKICYTDHRCLLIPPFRFSWPLFFYFFLGQGGGVGNGGSSYTKTYTSCYDWRMSGLPCLLYLNLPVVILCFFNYLDQRNAKNMFQVNSFVLSKTNKCQKYVSRKRNFIF